MENIDYWGRYSHELSLVRFPIVVITILIGIEKCDIQVV